MKIAEFAPIIFPGITADGQGKDAALIVKEKTEAMTFRVFEGKVETLNGQAKQGLAPVKDAAPEKQIAFLYALILEAEKISRPIVLRVREDGGRVQLSKI